MKKFLFIAAAGLAMVSCSKDSEVIPSVENGKQNAINFLMVTKNMGRAGTEDMQNLKHYNFGVWAYKDNDATHEIMGNYLVGFFGQGNNPAVGYDFTATSTFTQSLQPGVGGGTTSSWGYEGLGKSEYPKPGSTITTGCYDPDVHNGYFSNIPNQYVRYFDFSSTYTEFYAYAPYIESATPVSYDNSTHEMVFPAGSIIADYDDVSKFEYLYAYNKIGVGAYGSAVPLTFSHLNAKVKIAFWEDIAGYGVKMEELTASTPIMAVPATVTAGPTYTYSEKLAKTTGVTLDFSSAPTITLNWNTHPTTTYNVGSPANTTIDANVKDKALVFKIPTGNRISTSKPVVDTDYSPTTYYAIPKGSEVGLTFRVSFRLISTTGEEILVKNAAVHVPAANCVWEAGKAYTYIFRITKDATGTTGDPGSITVDPSVPGKALYPIVFDDIKVYDWTDAPATDHDIN